MPNLNLADHVSSCKINLLVTYLLRKYVLTYNSYATRYEYIIFEASKVNITRYHSSHLILLLITFCVPYTKKVKYVHTLDNT